MCEKGKLAPNTEVGLGGSTLGRRCFSWTFRAGFFRSGFPAGAGDGAGRLLRGAGAGSGRVDVGPAGAMGAVARGGLTVDVGGDVVAGGEGAGGAGLGSYPWESGPGAGSGAGAGAGSGATAPPD